MEIKIVRKVLEENENLAAVVRKQLRQNKQSMINIMGSPGAGKTKLLEALIGELKEQGKKPGVIVGDITTTCDADRFAACAVPVSQINTDLFGGACHLGANAVLGGLETLKGQDIDIILLENVGNLVCPAEFDTGADANMVVLSAAEGEDKPLKYPLMFQNTETALISKVDIIEALGTDINLIRSNIKKVNPKMHIIEVSGKTGQGLSQLSAKIVEVYKKQFM